MMMHGYTTLSDRWLPFTGQLCSRLPLGDRVVYLLVAFALSKVSMTAAGSHVQLAYESLVLPLAHGICMQCQLHGYVCVLASGYSQQHTLYTLWMSAGHPATCPKHICQTQT